MAEWVQGTVVENIHWTENLFSLRIDAGIDEYKAGQFTSLALDIDGERIARPYSHLSSPGQRPLEYFFYTATDGILSNALVKLQSGDKLWLKKQSNGFFVLDEVPEAKQLWMLGTGTGVAPFFSILHTDEPWHRFETIALVYAVRTQADLRYLDLIEGLQQRYGERFRFQAFVSREQVQDTIYGRIPAAIENESLEQAVELPMSVDSSHFMLCGNPDMVKDVTDVLKARGFIKNRRRTPGHITTENYW